MAQVASPSVFAGVARGNLEFAASPVWDDGRAEISVYDTRGTKYGIERRYETRILVVKEDVVSGTLEKSSAGPTAETGEAFKLIVEHDIPTGTYTYHQSVVVHASRHRLVPMSLAMNSIESCGLASVRIRPEPRGLRFRGSSYWEGESHLDTTIVGSDDRTIASEIVFYDALPLWVRGAPVEWSDSIGVELLPTQLENRARVPVLRRASIERSAAGGDTLVVTVRHAAGEDRFWIGNVPERPLLRWVKADGSELVLRKRVRLDYWNHTKPGDERLLR
jgi:hypothetical protein